MPEMQTVVDWWQYYDQAVVELARVRLHGILQEIERNVHGDGKLFVYSATPWFPCCMLFKLVICDGLVLLRIFLL